MAHFPSRRIPAGYRYPRYPRRAGVLRWMLLPLGLLGCGAAAYTYLHGGGPSNVPVRFVIAASGTANEPRPGLPGDITQELRSAGQASTAATAYVVDPGTGAATAISLTPRLPDGEVDNGPTRGSALDAGILRIQQVLAGQRAQGPFDLLATITAAVRAVPPPATLILVSSGLSTSGALDFRQAGWYASPRSLAAQLKSRRLLPSLAGYQVVFSGLGVVDGRQPALPLPQQDTVKSYWMAICRAAAAASCTVDDTSRPILPSRSEIPVPVVAVPRVWTFQGPQHTISASLPDALLFAFDSAVLLPAADGILQPLVQRARRLHLLVSITGHASPDGGTAAYNLALSKRRAEAVRSRLIALGLPAAWIISVTGAGTAGHGPASCLVHGQVDETICAQLRRVVIAMAPHRNQP
jgi:outer membrane protein OmpA-like peptidoglycan-associated protein